MSALYDADFVLWSEQQASLLRRLARGKKVNDVDWPNLVEEVDSLGRSAISAVRSLVQNALEHLLKAAAWPMAATVPKWLAEAETFLDAAEDDWTASMASRIDLATVYGKALKHVRKLQFEEGPAGPLPEACPVTLSELIGGDVDRLAARFRVPNR